MQNAIENLKIRNELEKEILKYKLELDLSKLSLNFLTKESLREKGIFTSRGIGRELVPRDKKALDVTTACYRFSDLYLIDSDLPDPINKFTQKLLEICQQFEIRSNTQLSDLYAKLSHEIHGFPWPGATVYIYKGNLSSTEVSLLDSICSFMDAKTEIHDTTPS